MSLDTELKRRGVIQISPLDLFPNPNTEINAYDRKLVSNIYPSITAAIRRTLTWFFVKDTNSNGQWVQDTRSVFSSSKVSKPSTIWVPDTRVPVETEE